MGREGLCANCRTSNDLVNHEMKATKPKKQKQNKNIQQKQYDQCFEFCSVLVETSEKFCTSMQTKMRNPLIPHRIEFGSILNHFGCAFWAFLFPLKAKPLPKTFDLNTRDGGKREQDEAKSG